MLSSGGKMRTCPPLQLSPQETIDQQPVSTNQDAIQENTTSHSSPPLFQPIDSPNTVAAEIPKIILDRPLHLLGRGDDAIDISSSGTSERCRLLDCRAFVDEKALRILEYTTFPAVAYCAVSYVWRNALDKKSFVDKDRGIDFDVRGAEEADPINTNVLYHVCMASLRRNCAYVWLDRVCIMQTCKEDKRWQIKNMYHMYQACNACIVLAGGLQNMVSLDDQTLWIHRGWTLQEALAPPVVEVLFAWKLSSGLAGAGGYDGLDPLEEAVPNQSAVTSLFVLLRACAVGVMTFIPNGQEKTLRVEANIFSSYPVQQFYRDFPFWGPTRKLLSPNVAALCVAMDPAMDEDCKLYAIWQSAWMRTSSRPVDMVLSIMGLFGVSLDPKSFKPGDRLRATIALAHAILAKGGRATWLGLSFKLPPCKNLSTFPIFPRTRVAGKALVKMSEGMREVSELMDNEYHLSGPLLPFPRGTIDEKGYFRFVGKAVRVEPARKARMNKEDDISKPKTFKASDGSTWKLCSSLAADAPKRVQTLAFAVLLGWYNAYFPGQTPSHDANNIRAMLVIEHAPGKFHVQSYLFFSITCGQWVMAWEDHEFCVGPEIMMEQPANDDDEGESELVEFISRDPQLQRSAPNIPMPPHPTLMELAARKARWAVPQSILERGDGGLLGAYKNRLGASPDTTEGSTARTQYTATLHDG